MEGFLVLIYLFLFIPTLVVPVSWMAWVFLLKLTGRDVRNPFSVADIVTPAICVLIRGEIDAYVLVTHKRMGNLFEIVVLGGVWALTLLVRLCVMFLRSDSNKCTLAWLLDFGVIIFTAILAVLIPSTVE